jgi:hypothetical protein
VGTGGSGSRRYAAAAAVVGVVTGVVLLVVAFVPQPRAPGVHSQAREPSRAVTPPSPVASDPPSLREGDTGVPDLIRGPVLPAASPVSVSIPRLRVSSPLETLGVDAQGSMEVPVDPARAGWYARGPTPGALGPAVIAGHVTWNQVPAVFFDLAALRPGDLVRVERADHRVAVFSVTRVEQYRKSQFPTGEVFGAIDHAGLRLITCGGQYDDSARRYRDNVVVFATLTDV